MFKIRNRASRRRRGFGLVETVICIVIGAVLAAAVFAGGASTIKKSQVSRTSSDLHNFSIAIETFLNETPSVANSHQGSNFEKFIKAINYNLPADYQLSETKITTSATTTAISESGGNITVNSIVNDANTNVAVYESLKTDAWGNHYYLILDNGERHGKDNSDFYITVVSAGADAKTELAGRIGGLGTDAKNIDDVFLVVQYTNGDVSAYTYEAATMTLNYYDVTNNKLEKLTLGDALYSAADGDSTVKCPVNF